MDPRRGRLTRAEFNRLSAAATIPLSRNPFPEFDQNAT